MEAKARKKYDPAFKREAVALCAKPGCTARSVERDLGLYPGAITHWKRELHKDRVDAFPGTGHLRPLEEETRRLRRERDIARQERDILKKAVAIFSKTPRAGIGS